jgi:16S rRNA (guanine1207-N2)-methyltransferase
LAHYFTDNSNLSSNRKEHSFRFSGRLYEFTTDNGVFSKTGVDRGTQVLLSALQGEPLHGSLLDMGCGYGVLSVVLKTLFPDTTVTSADINPRAVELTELNCERNDAPCRVLVSDGFSQLKESYDAVITNPPIRTGKKVIYRMFEDAYSHLKKDGCLYAVIRKQQGAESAVKKFNEIFGNCEITAREKGYWVLKSRKLTD